jgi:autoinducer 2-degrading protein
MLIRLVHATVKSNQTEDFVDLTRAHAQTSEGEAGVLRFDLLQNTEDPAGFFMVIWFEDEAARARHFETQHFKAWRTAVDPMFAGPLEGHSCRSLIDR